MPLRVAPLTEDDFSTLISHAETGFMPGDDLTPGPYPLTWPVTTKEEAQLRARCHFHIQRLRFRNDPSVRYVKVIDESAGVKDEDKILAVGRWHFYEHGYRYETEREWEMIPKMMPDHVVNPLSALGEKKASWPPPNLKVEVNDYILTTRDSFRSQWIPKTSPCWVLMHLVTRPRHRRRGAANMLVRWGQEQAVKTGNGVQCFLEAGSQGAPVYRKCGFVLGSDSQRIDLRKFMEEGNGVPEGFDMLPMRWAPGMDMGPGAVAGNRVERPALSGKELSSFLEQALTTRLP